MSSTHDEGPRASILIVCYLQVDLLLLALESLRRVVVDDGLAETIVLFNGTPCEERERVREALGDAHVINSRVNLGFGGGNNRAARAARGEYLVFLNDDTEVQRGWLEALVETADAHPEAGAVGSRIFKPDGSLQEAGSVIWRDGSTIGVGRGLAPGSHRYGYLREVDYVSACSLLVRRGLFEQLGGFDERFFPAYNEDVDLCLAIRARGSRILYQPRSTVIHHESQTGGDTKTFLILRGRGLLREKWGAALARFAEPAPQDQYLIESAVHRGRRSRRRVLIVDDRLPDQGAGSGFGRMLDATRELSGAGYAISFYPTERPAGDHAELSELGVDVLEGDLVTHLRRPSSIYDVAIVSRPHNFGAVERLRRWQPQCAVVYDAESLFHRRLEREAQLRASDPQASAAKRAEAASARELEGRIVRSADRVVSVSNIEAEFLRRLPGACPISVIEPFQPGTMMTPALFGERRGMVFVAGWAAPYPSPNSDGLEWMMENVMPRIESQIPWARISVSGRSPHRQILRFGGPMLRFLGHVADLGELYGASRVAVVPVRFGAGIKIKVIEALQYGVPVVTTSVGAEGIEADPGAIFICDDPGAFAERVITMLDDPREWETARAAIGRLHSRWNRRARESWASLVDTALMEKTIGNVSI